MTDIDAIGEALRSSDTGDREPAEAALARIAAALARKDAALRDCWGDAYLIAMDELPVGKGLESIISTARAALAALEEEP